MTSGKDQSKETIECNEHGPRQQAFVCRHLLQGEHQGFYWGTDPEDPQNLCPDAWCSECDEALQASGGAWNDESEAFAQIRLVCDACYERIRLRNMPVDLEQQWQESRFYRPA